MATTILKANGSNGNKSSDLPETHDDIAYLSNFKECLLYEQYLLTSKGQMQILTVFGRTNEPVMKPLNLIDVVNLGMNFTNISLFSR